MKTRRNNLLVLLATASIFILGTGVGQVFAQHTITISDQIFDDWSGTLDNDSIADPPVDSFESRHESTGGNGEDHLFIQHEYGGGAGGFSVLHCGSLVYDPSSLGAIDSLDVSFDVKQDPDASVPISGAMLVEVRLKQSGIEFATFTAFTLSDQQTWKSVSFPGMTDADFVEAGTGGTLPPDFSSSGSPIDFCILTANSAVSHSLHRNIARLDNLTITLRTLTPVLDCVGFDSPLANGPVTVKGRNRALSHRGGLLDADGFLVSDLDIVSPPVIQVIYDTGQPGDEPTEVKALSPGNGTEGNQFVYDPITGQWRFNLLTKNHSAPGVYTTTMESGDESEYVIHPPTCSAQFVVQE